MHHAGPADSAGESVCSLSSPPRPRLAFRVGVVGHRPNRLQQADLKKLATQVHSVLTVIRGAVLQVKKDCDTLYDATEPLLRAVSPLAEGSDRIFAEQAVDLGFELCCVMPFHQADFEQDFVPEKSLDPGSLSHFRGLLARATTRFELDGSRVDEVAAYGVGGHVVLNQSDVLVVVWDGERQNKRGGTEETLGAALSGGVPVVWVDACAPHAWQLLTSTSKLPDGQPGKRAVPAKASDIENLQAFVRELLVLPQIPPSRSKSSDLNSHVKDEEPAKNLAIFYSERQPRRSYAVLWKAFRDVVADGKWPLISFSVAPFEAGVEGEWPKNQSSPIGRLVDYLRPYYAWPDKLAVLYADRYRSAFIGAFALAAGAVGMALLPVGMRLAPHCWGERICIGIELAAILVILGLVFQGRRQRWHERWLEYRLTAELVRHLRLVATLGGARPIPQVPAHWTTYGQPAASWMAWYVRAIERSVGLPSSRIDRDHLTSCLEDLHSTVTSQIEFHRRSSERCEQIQKRLHHWGIWSLGVTLICCGLHFIPAIWHSVALPDYLLAGLTFACGFFPALGAALAGILNQGEFRRIAKRSEAMYGQLTRLSDSVRELRQQINQEANAEEKQLSPHVAALANDTARLLVNEVLDWRVVFLDQPLKPPA